MQNISNIEFDILLDGVTQEINIDTIKSKDDLIRYIVHIYGDQSKYRRYHPKLIYVAWLIYLTLFTSLIYIAINGGLSGNDALRISFRSLWITMANITYFSFVVISVIAAYTSIRLEKFSISLAITCILYYAFFSLGILYSCYHFFRYGYFFKKQWLKSAIKIQLVLFLIPFTGYVGYFIGNIL